MHENQKKKKNAWKKEEDGGVELQWENPIWNMVEVFEEAFGSWYKCLLWEKANLVIWLCIESQEVKFITRDRRNLVQEFSDVWSQSKIARNF